jgi:hypothetical protein
MITQNENNKNLASIIEEVVFYVMLSFPALYKFLLSSSTFFKSKSKNKCKSKLQLNLTARYF